MALSNKIQVTGRPIVKMVLFVSAVALVAGGLIAWDRLNKIPPFLTFSGISSNATSTVMLEQGPKKWVLVPLEGLSYMAPEEELQNYKISTTIQSGPRYQDLQIRVNRSTGKAQIIASGFDPAEALTLKKDGATVLSDLHFDWSGKIELSQDLPEKGSSVLCLSAGADFVMCHTLPEGKRV